jgi:hypothetical protein
MLVQRCERSVRWMVWGERRKSGMEEEEEKEILKVERQELLVGAETTLKLLHSNHKIDVTCSCQDSGALTEIG